MKAIRFVFGAIAAVWLIGITLFGLGTTYLTHNPEEGAAVLMGAASMDRDDDVITQVGQFRSGHAAGRDMTEQAQDERLKRRVEDYARARNGWGNTDVERDSDWGESAQ